LARTYGKSVVLVVSYPAPSVVIASDPRRRTLRRSWSDNVVGAPVIPAGLRSWHHTDRNTIAVCCWEKYQLGLIGRRDCFAHTITEAHQERQAVAAKPDDL
jgi:hypothetical protein